MTFLDDSLLFSYGHFNNINDQWEKLPTFVVVEAIYYVMAVAAFIHAIANGRMHLLAFFIVLLGGMWVDIFYMEIPSVNSFWHAQGMIMITPRLPVYIPCVYIAFLYYSLVIPWRLNIPTVSKICYSGLLGRFIYAPYDVVGPIFVWWTWHTSDPLYENRLYNAPVSSIVFTTALAVSAAALMSLTVSLSNSTSPLGLLKSFLASTVPLPMVMGILVWQLLMLGNQSEWQRPTENAVLVCDLLTTTGFVYGLLAKPTGAASFEPTRRLDGLINVLFAGYCCMFLGFILFGDSEAHISRGVHQELGPCDVVDPMPFSDDSPLMDFVLRRGKYLCTDSLNNESAFQLDCPDGTARYDPSDETGNRWYTVCGVPFTREDYIFPVSAYSMVAFALVTYGLSFSGHSDFGIHVRKPSQAVTKKHE